MPSIHCAFSSFLLGPDCPWPFHLCPRSHPAPQRGLKLCDLQDSSTLAHTPLSCFSAQAPSSAPSPVLSSSSRTHCLCLHLLWTPLTRVPLTFAMDFFLCTCSSGGLWHVEQCLTLLWETLQPPVTHGSLIQGSLPPMSPPDP